MSYEMTGTIKLIRGTETFSSGFKKREFVITTDDKYPQDVKFEKTSGASSDTDHTKTLDKFSDGQTVTVEFDIRGNEHNDRYYVNLTAWKITAESGSETARPEAPASQPELGEDDMPF